MNHRPIIDEPHQRYWRSRSNMRIRKARLTKKMGKLAAIVIGNLVLLTFLIYVGVAAVRGAGRSELALEQIAVDGADRVAPEAIAERLAPYLGQSLLELDLAEMEQVVRNSPWIFAAEVKRVLPNTIRVSLHERVPAAVALIEGRAHLIDRTGFVIGPTGAELADDLPVLTGLEGLDEAALVAALARGAAMLERLRTASELFASEISELNPVEADRVMVHTLGAGPPLLLDPDRVERNVLSYLSMREEISRRVGGVDYVDLRWADRITVKPVEATR